MQKKQLTILRKHGELWSDQDYRDYLSVAIKKDQNSLIGSKNILFEGNHLRESEFTLTFYNEILHVDQRVFKVLEESIESFLHPLIGWSGPGVEEKISKRLKLCPPIKEWKVKMLCKEITELMEHFEELVTEKLGLLSIPTNERELISTWYFYLPEQNVAKLIELLKFDVFQGERIESFGYPFIRKVPKNQYLLADYFYKHDKLCLLRDAVSILENILYLKDIIDKLENPDRELLQNNNTDQDKIKNKIGYEEILSEIEKSENKFWKAIDMEIVVKHFKVLIEPKNKDGNPYLSKEQFISFLKKGFLNESDQPKQKINCLPGEKGKVISRFLEFYDLAVIYYMHPAKKAKFINLFTDCFDNWEPSTIPPLFKKGKTSGKW